MAITLRAANVEYLALSVHGSALSVQMVRMEEWVGSHYLALSVHGSALSVHFGPHGARSQEMLHGLELPLMIARLLTSTSVVVRVELYTLT